MKLPHQSLSGSMLLSALGRGESKGWRVWFTVATFLSLVCNFIILIGCTSPAARGIYLFRVSSADLVEATSSLTNTSSDALDVSGLPNHWYWGLSGTCAVYEDSTVSCRRAFPPTFSLQSVLESAISSSPNTTTDSDAALPDAWTDALSDLSILLSPLHAKFTTYIQAASALSILSVLLSLAAFTLSILSLTLWDGRPARWLFYGPAFLDACLLAGAGILVMQGMENGPRAVIELSGMEQGNERTYVGPGFFVLFGGALLKLVAVPIFFLIVFFLVLVVVFLVSIAVACCLGGREEKEKESDEQPLGVYPGYPEQKAYV